MAKCVGICIGGPWAGREVKCDGREFKAPLPFDMDSMSFDPNVKPSDVIRSTHVSYYYRAGLRFEGSDIEFNFWTLGYDTPKSWDIFTELLDAYREKHCEKENSHNVR